MKREDLISVLKAQQWARCKGELDALVCLEGSNFPVYEGNKVITGEWKVLQDCINDFIAKVESESWDE